MFLNNLSSLSLNRLIDACSTNLWMFSEVSSAESSQLEVAIIVMVVIPAFLVLLLQLALKEPNIEPATNGALSATE